MKVYETPDFVLTQLSFSFPKNKSVWKSHLNRGDMIVTRPFALYNTELTR